MVNFPGPFCESAGITVESLLKPGSSLPRVGKENFVKGIVVELNDFRKEKKISWDTFYQWIMQVWYDTSKLPSLSAVKVNLSRFDDKRRLLRKNKQHGMLHALMSEPFLGEKRRMTVRCQQRVPAGALDSVEVAVLAEVNQSLATELSDAQNLLSSQEKAIEDLTKKMGKVSIRNVNKKLRRREGQIAALTQEVKKRKRLSAHLKRIESNAERYRINLHNMRKKSGSVVDKVQQLEKKILSMEESIDTRAEVHVKEVADLKNALESTRDEYDTLVGRVNDLESACLETKEHKMKYLDNIRQCCMELLSLNVGVLNVESIIRSVLQHCAGFSIKELPQKATLVRILAEMKGITYYQLAEMLSKEENLTLHSDGTTKFGEHYYSFQISTPTTSYSLGLAEMSTGSASHVLETFQQVLSDVELAAGPKAGAIILSKIKNTMSDRHIVEKNFNQLLEDYRGSVLPELVKSWDQMTLDEQTSMTTMNNFFCGMHLIVGIADVAAATLVQWESSHFEGNPPFQSKFSRKSESGTVRLIRTACKALSKHGNEQCGVYQAFTSYLSSKAIKKNPLATFKGNRFNILFYDAGALYYISDLVKAFFKDIWQTPNQLLRAVNQDIQVPEYVAGCKALGLVNKIITGPLWRVLESDISICDRIWENPPYGIHARFAQCAFLVAQV